MACEPSWKSLFLMCSVCDTSENGLGKRGLDLDSISNPFCIAPKRLPRSRKIFGDVNFAILERMASRLHVGGRLGQQFMA
ncbi:MAG: hypothetical protein DWI02_13315 [Planctomycetota bacterium]|nr:MAG: hypothetical protein DWI02_13315 [Planctomycetota bacterium]